MASLKEIAASVADSEKTGGGCQACGRRNQPRRGTVKLLRWRATWEGRRGGWRATWEGGTEVFEGRGSAGKLWGPRR